MFEDHEYHSRFDEPIDHAAWTDPRATDWTQPREILNPYPELWAQWQAHMNDPSPRSSRRERRLHVVVDQARRSSRFGSPVFDRVIEVALRLVGHGSPLVHAPGSRPKVSVGPART